MGEAYLSKDSSLGSIQSAFVDVLKSSGKSIPITGISKTAPSADTYYEFIAGSITLPFGVNCCEFTCNGGSFSDSYATGKFSQFSLVQAGVGRSGYSRLYTRSSSDNNVTADFFVEILSDYTAQCGVRFFTERTLYQCIPTFTDGVFLGKLTIV